MTSAKINIPLFDLAGIDKYIIGAGGGGNPAYGKDNGICIIEKDAPEGAEPHFFSTEEFIRKIQATAAEDSPEDFDADESIVDGIREETLKDTVQDENAIFIVALGEEHLYLVKFNGEFSLLEKTPIKADAILLRNNNLFVLENGRAYGMLHILSNGFLREKSEEPQGKDRSEEYFYQLYKRGHEIVPRRECGTRDIPANWARFFVKNKKIHKIIFSDGVSSFVYKNKQYNLEGEVTHCGVAGDSLVLCLNRGGTCLLHFIRSSEKVFSIPKATAMHISEDNRVVVATSDGDALVYVNDVFYSKTHISNLPVTGLYLSKNMLYYSIITGHIESINIQPINYSRFLQVSLLIIVIGFIIAYWSR
ncbi:hypothetical protein ENBRE01_3056 [Enteropsectra breve]|nr:hypothetical protein ENBRE01_3056 [Enteropsectra breve]